MAHRFANPDPRHLPHGPAAVWRWAVGDRLRGRRRIAPAGPPAPERPIDLAALTAEGARPSLTWLGHASFLGRLGDELFAVDPVLSRRIGVVYKRHGRPPLTPDELPRLDVVLLSHNHYDHLDLPTLRAVEPGTPFVTPRGLGRWLERRGFSPVVELDWWQTTRVGGLEITLVPARHWSRRSILDTNQTLWGGFVIRSQATAVYHAGDSATFDGFAEIGDRFPGLAAAMIPVGGYLPGWFMENNHMTPEQGAQAFLDSGARLMLPMHWGTFQLTDEPVAEPGARLAEWWHKNAPDDGRRLALLAVGETVELDGDAGGEAVGAEAE